MRLCVALKYIWCEFGQNKGSGLDARAKSMFNCTFTCFSYYKYMKLFVGNGGYEFGQNGFSGLDVRAGLGDVRTFSGNFFSGFIRPQNEF